MQCKLTPINMIFIAVYENQKFSIIPETPDEYIVFTRKLLFSIFIIFLDLICVFLLPLILILSIVIFFTEKRINTGRLGNKFDWKKVLYIENNKIELLSFS